MCSDQGALFIMQPVHRWMACPYIWFLLWICMSHCCRSVFLLIFCEFPDYVTKYVQSTFELFLSQCYLLLSLNKVLKHFPLPIMNPKISCSPIASFLPLLCVGL